MKIKAGFVTNSSSTTYIIIDMDNSFPDLIQEIKNWDLEINEYQYFRPLEYECFTPDKIEELQVFNNHGKKLDWVEKATGCKHNKLGSRELYENALKTLSSGKTIHFIVISNDLWLADFVNCYENLKIANCSDWLEPMEWKNE